MSSNDASKKRRVDADNNIIGGICGTAATGVEDIIAEMKVHMTRMQDEMNELKAENKCLKSRCSSLERSVTIIAKEQKWKYSAPDIPRSHWEELGFNEGYFWEMERFLGCIKRYTCKLRNDGVDNTYARNAYISLGDPGGDIVLLHDDALLPHWKELANAMQLYQEDEPFTLSIFNVQLSPPVIDLLLPILKYKPVRSIVLQNNSFVNNIREGIEFAVEVMESNETIQGFYWASNTINNMEDARLLVEAVNSHPAINQVRLENCFDDDVNGYAVLIPLLASDKNFEEIDFDNNAIRTGGSTELPDLIARNPPLQKLFFSDNNLNDGDAVLIARALKQNSNLEVLNLYDNNFTEVGVKALREAAYDSTSLNSVADSNHTCRVEGVDFGGIPSNPYDRENSGHARAQKLYHLLSSRNREGTNVRHLNSEFGGEDDDKEDTLALVPKVLECVYRYSHERVNSSVPPLSIMYEILRSWKMPELYDGRGAKGNHMS